MSSSVKLKILLDSTYILPIVGVEVEGINKALTVLRELRRRKEAKFYYTQFNIIEILSKVAKTNYDHNIVVKGLSLIEEEFELAYPTVDGYIKALELKKKGFKDMIDLLLYVTSLTCNLQFLTRDKTLIDFLKNLNEETGNILHEDELIERYLQ